jgi:iduronate 2-sulfatase
MRVNLSKATGFVVSVLVFICLSHSYTSANETNQNLIFKSEPAIKNVLFIVSDDLKASVLGCYGDKQCKTPNIDKLASQGMVFQRAYCQGTWCAPSRLSFMHSRYQGASEVNLGVHFQNNGYHTSRVGKIYHMRVPGDVIAGTNGPDIASTWTERYNSAGPEAHTPGDYACLNLNIFTRELQGRQSTKMPHRPFVTVSYEGDGSDQADFKTAEKAIEVLRERRSANQPFVLCVGMVRPHYPMVAPQKYFDLYDWTKIKLPEVAADDLKDIPRLGMGQSSSKQTGIGKYPDNQKKMWAGYYASVTFMDEQVGKVIDELDRLGLRDSTAIVFISDHGYHLGEHQWWQKSNMHEEVARVPMIISAPGFQGGESFSPVELVDLFPTLSNLAGLEIPASVQGKSVVPIMKDPTAKVRDAALTIHNGLAIRSGKHAYIRYKDGSEELYDMNSDPNQFKNLVGSEYHLEALELNRKALDARVSEHDLVLPKSKKNKNQNGKSKSTKTK